MLLIGTLGTAFSPSHHTADPSCALRSHCQGFPISCSSFLLLRYFPFVYCNGFVVSDRVFRHPCPMWCTDLSMGLASGIEPRSRLSSSALASMA
jgi:hypothetical protein